MGFSASTIRRPWGPCSILDSGHARGRKDIAVIGCGNVRHAELLRVPLSSVDQDSAGHPGDRRLRWRSAWWNPRRGRPRRRRFCYRQRSWRGKSGSRLSGVDGTSSPAGRGHASPYDGCGVGAGHARPSLRYRFARRLAAAGLPVKIERSIRHRPWLGSPYRLGVQVVAGVELRAHALRVVRVPNGGIEIHHRVECPTGADPGVHGFFADRFRRAPSCMGRPMERMSAYSR